jgi:hypothetical protein
MRSFLWLTAALLSSALHAQVLMPVDPQHCVWHNGDNPAWADAALDENGWQPVAQWHLDPRQPSVWMRCHTEVAGLAAQSPAVQLSFPAAWQLYANGVPLATSGSLISGSFPSFALRTIPIPPSMAEGPLLLALRMVIRNAEASAPLGLPQLTLGSAGVLTDHRDAAILSGIQSVAFTLSCYAVIALVGLILVGLWVTDRERRELLFLGFACVGNFILRLWTSGPIMHFAWPSQLWWIVYEAANLAFLFEILFVISLNRRRVPAWLWLLLTCDYLPDPALFLGLFLPPGVSLRIQYFFNFTLYPWITPLTLATLVAALIVAFHPWTSLPPRIRVVAGFSILWIATDWLFYLASITNLFRGSESFLIDAQALSTLAVLVVLLALLFREQRHTALERAAFSSEREAARAVQQVLIPEEIPTIHGFKIESVYKPAGEVGGDFFQILPTPANGVLIVIGDVSGKGMPAAMTVSLLVGTLRTLAHYTQNPGEILSAMNQRILARSQGGFTTCLVVRIDPDGTVTAANAGHLAPYANSKELPLQNGLPLGLSADAQYLESLHQLPPSAPLTLITDGIVEARNSDGELFGFERTAAISAHSADHIARTAQQFGQEDDITVLTLTRSSLPEQSTTQLPIEAFSPPLA